MHTWTGAGRGLRNAVQHLGFLVSAVFMFFDLIGAHWSCRSWN